MTINLDQLADRARVQETTPAEFLQIMATILLAQQVERVADMLDKIVETAADGHFYVKTSPE